MSFDSLTISFDNLNEMDKFHEIYYQSLCKNIEITLIALYVYLRIEFVVKTFP